MLLYDIEFEYCYQIIFVQSVQRWSNFDWTIVKEDAGLMRLVDLLSNVLEKNWDTTQRGNSHSILEHALSWVPFPTFVEVYREFLIKLYYLYM